MIFRNGTNNPRPGALKQKECIKCQSFIVTGKETRTNGNNDDPGKCRRLQVQLGRSRYPQYLR